MDPLQKDDIIQIDQKDNLKIFLKGEPQILGVTQILIGLMKVCLWALGLCLHVGGTYKYSYLLIFTGYPIWGSLFFFISGAVSIAAERKMTLGLIRGSLALNVLSAIMAGIGIIILIIDVIDNPKDETRYVIFLALAAGALLLTLLEASIAISLSVFGCKGTCFLTQVVVVHSTKPAPSSASAPCAHIYEELEFL